MAANKTIKRTLKNTKIQQGVKLDQHSTSRLHLKVKKKQNQQAAEGKDGNTIF